MVVVDQINESKPIHRMNVDLSKEAGGGREIEQVFGNVKVIEPFQKHNRVLAIKRLGRAYLAQHGMRLETVQR